jgi:dipeptidase D
MVCSAHENHANFDFKSQPIDVYMDGEWLKARGTTLGADDGIGVAACMALIEDPPTPHPPLELLLTMCAPRLPACLPAVGSSGRNFALISAA